EPYAEMTDAVRGLDEGASDVVIADQAELERQVRGLGIADRQRYAGVRHRNHDVRGGRRLARQLGADALARLVHALALDHAVRPGEIDVLEDAKAPGWIGERLDALDAFASRPHHLARLDVAHEAGAHDVERTGLRGQDRRAVQVPDHQRSDAEWVAHAVQRRGGQGDQGIGALDLAQRVDQTLDHARLPRSRDQVNDHLGVGGG